MPARGRAQDLASEATPTEKSGRTRAYNAGFEQLLVDANIYPDGYLRPDGTAFPQPENMDEIRRLLVLPRPSTICSDDDFRKFERAVIDAKNEEEVTISVLPKIYNLHEEGGADGRFRAQSFLLSNLEPLTNSSTPAAKPDLYYGARPEQLDTRIRKDLSRFVIPSARQELPIVPNFFLEAKGPHGTFAVARRQAWHCGVLGARGMYRLRSYQQQQPIPDRKADTITCVYAAQTLHMYTVHVQQLDQQRRLAYIMTLIDSIAMTGKRARYEEGVTAFLNAKDWTRKQRDNAIQQANERLLALTLPEAGDPEDDDAEDELAPSPRPVRSKRPRAQSERPRKRRG